MGCRVSFFNVVLRGEGKQCQQHQKCVSVLVVYSTLTLTILTAAWMQTCSVMSLQSLMVMVSTRVVISLLHFCSLIKSTMFLKLCSLVTSWAWAGHGTHLQEGWCTKFHKVITFDDEINPFSYFLVYQQYLESY